MTTFSKATILKAFPHKEACLFNLDVAIELSVGRDNLKDADRLEFLCDCHRALVERDVPKAIELSQRAGYNLMAEAIRLHFT